MVLQYSQEPYDLSTGKMGGGREKKGTVLFPSKGKRIQE